MTDIYLYSAPVVYPWYQYVWYYFCISLNMCKLLGLFAIGINYKEVVCITKSVAEHAVSGL